MPVPSVDSWIWHLAERAAQHCGALGTPARDVAVDARQKTGLLCVRLLDTSWPKPMVILEASIPLSGSDDADEVVATLSTAILLEVIRRREPQGREH